MNNKLQPALIGGVVLGLLSAIPFISLGNACCCSWAILGGALASYLYIKSSPAPVRVGDGAILGLLAGAIGAAIYLVVGIPLSFLMQSALLEFLGSFVQGFGPEAAEAFRRQAEVAQSQTIAQQLPGAILMGLIGSILLVGFATIGGLIGVAIFEKRKGGMDASSTPPPPPNFSEQPPSPPPPPNFSNPSGGGGYGSGM